MRLSKCLLLAVGALALAGRSTIPAPTEAEQTGNGGKNGGK